MKNDSKRLSDARTVALVTRHSSLRPSGGNSGGSESGFVGGGRWTTLCVIASDMGAGGAWEVRGR
jgi:hypothetical protein